MIVLSDTHFGAGDQADDFLCGDAFIGALRHSRRQGERIWIAGDLTEQAQAELKEIERAHPRECQAVEDYVEGIVRGNHDGPQDVLCGRPVCDFVVIRGTLIMHGHQFDPLNYGRWRFIGAAGSKLAGAIERALGTQADDAIEAWLNRRVLPGRFGDARGYRRRALRFMRQVGAERVVIGHTHHREARPPCFNCGHWTGPEAGQRSDAVWLKDSW